MTFVIGDIHGEISKLRTLINNILTIDSAASFVFIGDYIDKGEDAYSTLKFLQNLSNKHECVFLRGNHEYYWELLQDNKDHYADYLKKYGGLNTIHSINKNLSMYEVKVILFAEFSPLFLSLKNYHLADSYVITHSGIPADLFSATLEDIPAEKLLFNRYDFIKKQEQYKGNTVIFGHTGFYSPYYDGYKIGIDTAACYLESQPLTAFCTSAEFFINSSNNIIQLSEINQSFCPAIPRVKAWRQK
ncbi:MAG: serine/threonine protein phosphatase [Bacteroidetes bacterium]|nr:serine/threonine protein phosphatase [Bacteroidota bacterium]